MDEIVKKPRYELKPAMQPQQRPAWENMVHDRYTR